MVRPPSATLGISLFLIWLLLALNIFAGVLMIGALPASFVFEPVFTEFFSKKPPRIDASWLLPTLRAWIVLGLVMVAAVHVSLTRMKAVVETVGSGDPFVPENAARLKTIAWCTLITQLLHLAFGAMAATMNAAGSSIDWKFSASGWLAVVLLFVLARVFEEGTQLREDLGRMI